MNNKTDADFAQFLQSMVNLDALDRTTTVLGNELKDSQAIMDDIKGMIDAIYPIPSIPDAIPSKIGKMAEPNSNALRQEDLQNILTSGTPQLLMPDMDYDCDATDVVAVVAAIKSYVEELEKIFSPAPSDHTRERIQMKHLDDLELEQYASNLEQLSKWLSNLKPTKKAEGRNAELEAKLTVLCDDINNFTKMILAATTLNEANNKNWSLAETANALDYDNMINKLLANINIVSYSLKII